MKKLLLAITLLLAASQTPVDAQARHRHQHKDAVEATTQNNDDEAIEAVSDTTSDAQDSTFTTDNDEDDDADTSMISISPSDYDNPFSWFNGLWLAGIGGIFIALFIVLVVLLFLALPIILLIWLLRYLMKRSEMKAEMQRMAMERGFAQQQQGFTSQQTQDSYAQPQGTAAPQSSMHVNQEMDVFLWRKGIRNVSIGVGLMFLFGFMGADSIIGVGLLVACLGGGQMFMARTTGKKSNLNQNNDSIGGESSQNQQQ